MNSKKIDFEYVGLLILAFFPIYPFFLLSLSVFLYVGLTIASRISNKESKDHKPVYGLIFFSLLFYILLLIRGLFNENPVEELKYFRSSLSLLVFPITWLISKKTLTKKQYRNVLDCFILSSLILAIYILIFSMLYSLSTNEEFSIYYEKIEFLYVHPNYTSIFFFASIVLLYLKLIHGNERLAIVYSLMILFFSVILMLLATRIVLLTLILVIGIEIIRRKTFTKRGLLLFATSVLIVVLSSIYIKPLQKKIKEISSFDEYVLPYGMFPTSSQIRLGIYNCSIPLIQKNWVWGKGAYTLEKDINECYNKFNNFDKIQYNTHNYYMFLLGSSGIVCLLSFLIMMLIFIQLAISRNDMFYLYIILCILLMLLTENFLSRIQGVIFTMFFITVFIKSRAF